MIGTRRDEVEQADYSETRHIRQSLARATLRSILTAQFDDHGHVKGHTQEEVRWALGVVRAKPEWSIPVLRELGMKEEG